MNNQYYYGQQNNAQYPQGQQQNQYNYNQNQSGGYNYPPPTNNNYPPPQTQQNYNSNPHQVSDYQNGPIQYDNDQIFYGQGKSLESVEFNERKGFVVKVYSLLSFQLLVTFGIVLISYFSTGFRDLLIDPATYHAQPLFWVCFGISLATEIAIFCCKNVARKVPSNYIAFSIFTLSFSVVVAGSCAVCYDAFSNGGLLVVIASLLTFGVTVALTLYAWTTKTDFTLYGGALWIIAATLLILSILSFFFFNMILQLFICGLAIICYGFYLIYDTQLIIGGKAHELTVDDYIIGTMLIYIDIIILFLRILQILMILFGKK